MKIKENDKKQNLNCNGIDCIDFIENENASMVSVSSNIKEVIIDIDSTEYDEPSLTFNFILNTIINNNILSFKNLKYLKIGKFKIDNVLNSMKLLNDLLIKPNKLYNNENKCYFDFYDAFMGDIEYDYENDRMLTLDDSSFEQFVGYIREFYEYGKFRGGFKMNIKISQKTHNIYDLVDRIEDLGIKPFVNSDWMTRFEYNKRVKVRQYQQTYSDTPFFIVGVEPIAPFSHHF